MKNEPGILMGIAIASIAVLAFVGYNRYRHPASSRGLSNNSLPEIQVEELRARLAAEADKRVLAAYFSDSGATRNLGLAG